MAVSQAYKILWGTGVVFVILPHLNLGLLSDLKICGDSECESPMSRVKAIRDHYSKDCRFLSFRRGDIIFVYHKLTGKREDLWAGSIDKQFGYFPKDAVQEEQVHTTTEKVVETQESDFFCVDEFGYLIDSSHLDSDDDDADDENEKIQNQELETTQTTPYTNAESPSKSEDVSKEPPVSAQEADGTSTEEEENKNAAAASPGTHKEAQEAPAAPNEQGGSASSAWLGSSVTGWLGLATEEGRGNLAEGERKDETKETLAEGSFTSSVAGWLGLGGEGKPDDAVKSREEDSRQTADSFTSTMTGWLGFGEEKNTDHSTEKEQDEEREKEQEQEPAEKFRSRRMSLDLEGSQLHEEEKEEMGTLDWLGNELSNTLGFGLTNQESAHGITTEEEAEETVQVEEKQSTSSSWLDSWVGDVLGFGEDEIEDDESTGSGFKETDEDKTSEQPTGSENVDTGQSQHALTEEVRTETSNESKMEESPEDQNISSETETVPGNTEPVTADSNKNDIGTSDSTKASVLPEDAASEVDQKDISPQDKLEEKSVGGMFSVLNNFFQTGSEEEEEDNVSDDYKKETKVLNGERSAEMEDKDHKMPKSTENVGEDKNREPGEEEMKTTNDTDQDFLTQSDINLAPDFNSVDLNSNSMGQSVGKVELDKTENEVEERAEIPNQTDNTEDSTNTSVEIGASSDGHKGEGNNAETDVLQREISTTQTDDSAEQSQVSGGAEESSGKSQPLLSSDTAEGRNDPVTSEDDTLTAHSEETDIDHSDSLAMIGNNTEAQTHQGELGQEGEGHTVEGSSLEFGSFHSTNRSAEIVSENATEEDRGTFSTSESTTQMEGETEKDSKDNLQPQTETMVSEKYIVNESGLKSAIGSETETEEVEESKEEKQGETEELKEEEEIKALKKQQEVEEEKQNEVEELNEEGKQEEIEDLKKEEKQEAEEEIREEENQGEEEESKAEEKKDEMKEIKDIKRQEEVEELKEEEKQEAVKELKEDEKLEEVEELKEEEEQQQIEELKEENQGEEEESKAEEKKDEMKEIKDIKRQEEVEELKEEEKQEDVLELNEDERREDLKEVEEVKEKEKNVDEERQVQSSHFEVEMENTDRPESESNEKETQGEISLESVLSETSTRTEKRETENTQMGEEKREEENRKTEAVEEVKDELNEEEKQEMENVEDERRDKKEEGNLKCSNELCPQLVRDRDGNDSSNRLSSIDEREIETGKNNPMADNDPVLADKTEVSQTVPSEGMGRSEDRKQEEEKRNDDAEVDEGEKNSESNLTGNEDIKSTNSISDLNSLGVNQQQKSDYTDNDLLYSGESGQNSQANQIILGQTAKNKEDDELYSSEAKSTNLSDDNLLHQGDKTKPEDTETSGKETEQIHSDHKTSTEEDTDSDPVESQAVISEQVAQHVSRHPTGSSLLSDGHSDGTAETESGGAFGLFKNAFSFFRQTPATESSPSLDSNPGDTSKAQASLTTEQDLDSTTDSAQVYIQDLHTDTPIDLSQQQLQPSPPPFIQTSSPSPTQTLSHSSSLSSNTGSPLQPKTLSKHYKNLHTSMSVDEMAILMELFGTHKLQFLDYILGSSETMTDDPNNDESILLDIERLLHYHRETLVDLSKTLVNAPQDNEKTRMLLALQKLEVLLARVRETFNTGKSDISNTDHQAEARQDKEIATEQESSKMGDSFIGLDNNTPRDERMGLDKEKDGQLNGGTRTEWVNEDEKRREKERRSEEETVSPESHPHLQPGPPQPPEGGMKQILDFVHQITEDSTTRVQAARELLISLTVQARL